MSLLKRIYKRMMYAVNPNILGGNSDCDHVFIKQILYAYYKNEPSSSRIIRVCNKCGALNYKGDEND